MEFTLSSSSMGSATAEVPVSDYLASDATCARCSMKKIPHSRHVEDCWMCYFCVAGLLKVLWRGSVR